MKWIIQVPKGIEPGCYLLAIFKISLSRIVFDKKVVTDSLYPILYDLQADKIIDDHELAEKFMGKAQVNGRYAPFTEDMKMQSDVIDNIEYDLKEVIDNYVDGYQADQLMRINNSKKMRLQQTLQYYDTRIRSLEHSISTQESLQKSAILLNDTNMHERAERTLRLQRAQLQGLLQRKEDDMDRINKDVQLRVTDEVKSINLVRIV